MRKLILPKELIEKNITPISLIKDKKGDFIKCVQNIEGEYKILYFNEIKKDSQYEYIEVSDEINNYLTKKYKRSKKYSDCLKQV